MEKCPNCSNRLSQVDVLCPRCGALVETVQIKKNLSPATNSENKASQNDSPPISAENNNDALPIGLIDDSSMIPKTDTPAVTETSGSELFWNPEVNDGGLFDFSKTSQPSLENTSDIKESNLLSSNEPLSAAPDVEPAEPETRMGRRKKMAAESSAGSAFWASTYSGTAAEHLLDNTKNEDGGSDIITANQDTRTNLPDDNIKNTDLHYRLTESMNENVADTDSVEQKSAHRYRSQPDTDAPKYKKERRRKIPVPFVIVIWAVVAAALFLGFFYLDKYITANYGNYSDFVRRITNGKVLLDTNDTGTGLSNVIDTTVIASQTEDGRPAHTFNVTVAGASSVRVLPTGDTYEMTDGHAEFTLADEDIFRSLGVVTYEDTFITDGVSLEFTTGVLAQTFTYSSLELALTAADYTREHPFDSPITVPGETVAVSLLVSPEATVYINDENYTAQLDDDGLLATELPVADLENNFIIDVTQPGRQSVKDTLVVSRQLGQTLLAPENDYFRAFTDEVECRGLTDAGATVSAVLGDQTFTAIVAEDGAFSVTFTVANYGLHAFSLTAVSPNKNDSEAVVTVERLPEPNAFMESASEVTVDAIVNSADKRGDQGIKISSAIKGLTVDDGTQIFTLNSDDAVVECYYYGTVQLSDNSIYTMYGMADGANNKFYVMYIV